MGKKRDGLGYSVRRTAFNRMRKFGFTDRHRYDSMSARELIRKLTNAWCRPSDCCDVQLPQSRNAGAGEPPFASHSAAGECGVGAAVGGFRPHLLGVRPGFDRAGEAVAGIAAS